MDRLNLELGTPIYVFDMIYGLFDYELDYNFGVVDKNSEAKKYYFVRSYIDFKSRKRTFRYESHRKHIDNDGYICFSPCERQIERNYFIEIPMLEVMDKEKNIYHFEAERCCTTPQANDIESRIERARKRVELKIEQLAQEE